MRAAFFDAVKGGNMEDSTKWIVTQIDTVAGQEATVTFNDTIDIPSAGSGGAMHVTATNAVASTGNNVIIWQKIPLKKGHHYVVDAAFKDLGSLEANEFWCQWYVDTTTPVRGSDYLAEDSCRAQINTWNACQTDWAGLDITLTTWDCQNGKKSDTVVVGFDGMYTYGIKMGVWNASVVSYDIVIDNTSLTDLDSTVTAINTAKTVDANLYPNPADNIINIGGNVQFVNASIMNVLGQEVQNVSNFEKSISINGLRPGMYIIKLTDRNSNITVGKFEKR